MKLKSLLIIFVSFSLSPVLANQDINLCIGAFTKREAQSSSRPVWINAKSALKVCSCFYNKWQQGLDTAACGNIEIDRL